jgi:hypothetical protein
MPITTANAVVAQAVSWLWPERLPLGKFLLLDGDPDLGRSLRFLALFSGLFSGRSPPGTFVFPLP